jgi:hypothetical protein
MGRLPVGTAPEAAAIEQRFQLKVLPAAIALSMVAAAAHAQSARVTGSAGYLSEWEFSGKLSASAATNAFSGSVTWKHVGLCTHDGPETKLAEMSLRISRAGPAPRIHAMLVVDGARCEFSGPLSDNSTGRMDCPEAKGVPVTIKVNLDSPGGR